MIDKKTKEMDVLNLAFLGDAVYELKVRALMVSKNMKPSALHKLAVGFVSANSQAKDLKDIEDILTEDELSIVRRARNKNLRPPKHTKPQVYSLATGFEALFGALYVSGDFNRIDELFNIIREMHDGNNW